jgi:predicted  nucleic acid-binding Zn-ribbon protein
MGPVITALEGLQAIERDLSQVRRRRKARLRAVKAQEARIAKHQQERDSLQHSVLERRKQADGFELTLRQNEEHIARLRVNLNAAKTNKEYAALLTQINTQKADNAKYEEQALKILGEVDGLKSQIGEGDKLIAQEEAKLEEINANSAEEIRKLDTMLTNLQTKRDAAAQLLPETVLSLFDRLSGQYDGEALAKVQVNGRRPPYTYTCGGCFMSLNAEHANALRTHDEVRQCDNCRRILYIDPSEGQ